jgi:Flp pilus assembly protein TadG
MNLHIRALNRWRALRDPERREDGMVTAFTVIIVTALVLFAGLALDGGLALDSRIKAIDEAQEAARAGAQALNVATYRSSGQAVLDPSAAVGAANAYLAGTGDAGTVSVNGTVVTVMVTRSQHTRILSIIGIGSMTAHETASATAEQGK